MVADQHRRAGRPGRRQAAAAVGQHDRPAAGRGGGPDRVHDRGDALALVVVRAAEEHQQPPVARSRRCGSCPSGRPPRRRRSPAGRWSRSRRSASPSASTAGSQPGPEHERDVVAVDPGQPGELVCRLLGELLCGHGASLGAGGRSPTPGGPSPSGPQDFARRSLPPAAASSDHGPRSIGGSNRGGSSLCVAGAGSRLSSPCPWAPLRRLTPAPPPRLGPDRDRLATRLGRRRPPYGLAHGRPRSRPHRCAAAATCTRRPPSSCSPLASTGATPARPTPPPPEPTAS